MSQSSKSGSQPEQLARRNRDLSILNAIAEALNREIDLAQALQTALAQVASLLDLQTGWVWLLRDDTGESYLAAAQNLPPGLAHAPHRMEGRCYCLDTFRAGDLNGAANVNVVVCSRLKNLVDGTNGLRCHASIPLYAHGKKLGVMNVASRDWRELSPDDLRILHTVGDLVGIAVERARLFEQSVQLGAAEERNRLAREIHDTLAQGLAAITLQLETADALLENESQADRVRQIVQHALALTRKNLEEARRSVLDLRAAPLEGRRLPEALAVLAEEWAARGTLKLNQTFTGEFHPLPVRLEVGLFRIAQEALANVVQHAQARQIGVGLMITPEQVTLTIEDDGQGFDPSRIPAGHYGLIGIRERVKLLGGQLDVCSSPGEGTQLMVIVPLEASHSR
ncbi:MAG: GAF domain-containing sensor histidine kinase [Chloroflexi bacterium]|nr:MAG: GAF domain-containing sensor histidine kinase [Chloroflexota bacterium]